MHTWREDDEAQARTISQSCSSPALIPPTSFYNKRKSPDPKRRNKLEKKLFETLKGAAHRVKYQNRKTVTSQLQMRRSAFKGVSCLRRFPIQEPAINYLEALLGKGEGKEGCCDIGVYEEESSSGVSMEEKKKVKEGDEPVSNARAKYVGEFLKEKSLCFGDKKDGVSIIVLWCCHALLTMSCPGVPHQWAFVWFRMICYRHYGRWSPASFPVKHPKRANESILLRISDDFVITTGARWTCRIVITTS
mmetsp:Transcript_48114/g.58259  ORF Transcript_48114/g.58259 Transcript_48114/m.58259 type:complete len:248 (-) Transcript_48114:159-902(-)